VTEDGSSIFVAAGGISVRTTCGLRVRWRRFSTRLWWRNDHLS